MPGWEGLRGWWLGGTAGLVCTHSPETSVGLRWRGDDLEKWVDFTGGWGKLVCLGQGEGLRLTCEGRSWWQGREFSGRGRRIGEVGEFGRWDLAGLVVLAGESPCVWGGQWSCWLVWD